MSLVIFGYGYSSQHFVRTPGARYAPVLATVRSPERAARLSSPQELATQLAIGTIVGSAAMLQESGLDAATLRKNVTSPNGTTAAALKVFSDSNLEKIVTDAMSAARKRSQELA